MLALATRVSRGEVGNGRIVVQAGQGEEFRVSCDLLVNCAALGAQGLSRNLRGLDPASIPPLYYAKGNYFSLAARSPFSHLIYPMPDGAWLGVHATLDLGGRCRFGPDIHWVQSLDYDVDQRELNAFYGSIRRWWPQLPDGALHPDYTGIRPKLYARGEPAADFVIQGPAQHGVAGLITLYGIESPGITSSLAIAEEVLVLATQRTRRSGSAAVSVSR
jgi:L-2-hydroxyglutarate oxidase LhgO